MDAEDCQQEDLTARSCLEEAERAVAEVHGISCILIPYDKRDPVLLQVIRAVQQTLEIIREEARTLHGDELRAYCTARVQEMRAWSADVLSASKSPLLRLSDPDRIFTMFRDCWSTTAAQLRVSVLDIRECFDLHVLGALLGMSPGELCCLPLSSELVVALSPDGLVCDLEVPSCTFFLDAVVQLKLARECHEKLVQWAASKNAETAEPLNERVRLRAFIRQVLVTGVAAIEAALADYGRFAAAVAAHRTPQVDLTSAAQGGVTARLRRFATIWPLAFGRQPEELPEAATDMLALVQVRNRLVHHDGRVSAWHAMQLDLAWLATEYRLTARADLYKDPAAYGLDYTHIGTEYGFGVFTLNTVLATIDAFHSTIYPEQAKAAWMRIPRTEDGNIDLDFDFDTAKRTLTFQLGKQR